jgi:acyl carrier protein
MTAAELLAHLRTRGVILWANGDRLCFKSPKDVLTPAIRAELTECKQEILALLCQGDVFPGVSLPSLQATSRDRKLPLSYAQHGLWLMAQTTDHLPFNQPLAFRIWGPLNVTVLERSLNEIVHRHEILRTSCAVVGGEPVQVVMPSCTVAIATVDLRDLSVHERENAVMRLVMQEAHKPFDLGRAPLLQAKLLRIDDEEYMFILITHTFTVDGYSQGILLRELGQLYKAFSMGEVSPLPEHPIQFADYAVWQRQMLEGGHFAPQLAYWKKQLKDCPSILRWPVHNQGHTAPNYQGKIKTFSLPMHLSDTIRTLSRNEGVTVFAVFLAALNFLLYRLTGQADLVIGTTVSNRGHSELEGLIGYFANNLLLYTQLSDHLTFQRILKQCHEVTADALAHQDLPFEKLLEEFSADPEIPTIPKLQVMLVLHDYDVEDDLQLPGLILKKFPVDRGATSFDLSLHIAGASGPFSGSLEYSTEIFDADIIDRIYSHFKALLECVVTNPQQRLASLPFLTKAEQDELIQVWNNDRSILVANKDLPTSDDLIHGTATKVVPQTEVEQIIASIWQEILELENISINHNFFDLGGRSIHVIQVHSRLQKNLKRVIPIVDLFRYPTIRSLSQHLSREQGKQSSLRQSQNRTKLLRLSRERRMRDGMRRQTTIRQKEGGLPE